MKVYTRSGDDGTTGLFYGGRVRKDSARPTAYGSVDEAQAALGVARAAAGSGELDDILTGLCRDLYVVMAELATLDENRHKLQAGSTLVTGEMITALEHLVDTISERFETPTGFVIPGADPVAAALDVARTVTRRAERDSLVAVGDGSLVVPFLNRLSDLLWVLARWREGDHVMARDTAGTATTAAPGDDGPTGA